MVAWDAQTGVPLTPIVTWQDKRSHEILERLQQEGRAEEINRLSGLPLDPYFSAGKIAWLLEHDRAVGEAASAGTLRVGTVDSFLSDRLGAGFATVKSPNPPSHATPAVTGDRPSIRARDRAHAPPAGTTNKTMSGFA